MDSSSTVTPRVQRGAFHERPVIFHIVVFFSAFLIVFSRRPDAVLNAQFWAEDGKFWYADAYHFGLHSLFMPEAGYLHILPRFVAYFSVLFPLGFAPLVMNVCAMVVQILPANLFLSSRFAAIPFGTRLLGALVYLTLPNSFEIHANSTNIQWHLALAACLILFGEPVEERPWLTKTFDCVVLAIVALDSPLGIFLIPVAALLWWRRRDARFTWSFWMLIPGSVLQILVAVLSHSRRIAPNGATMAKLTGILGGQIFLSSLLGLRTFIQFYFFYNPRYLFPVELIAMVVGLAIMSYAAYYAPARLRLFLLFAALVLIAALRSPLASMETGYYQWDLLQVPGIGNRYYFFPMLGLIASLVWILKSSCASKIPRYGAAILLLLLPVGIYRDYQYRPFRDLQFQKFAADFEKAAPGTPFAIPINPVIPGYDWSLRLTKR